MLNREWHETHVMPHNASKEQRVAWHAGHARACDCRAMPESLRDAVEAFWAAEAQEEKQR